MLRESIVQGTVARHDSDMSSYSNNTIDTDINNNDNTKKKKILKGKLLGKSGLRTEVSSGLKDDSISNYSTLQKKIMKNENENFENIILNQFESKINFNNNEIINHEKKNHEKVALETNNNTDSNNSNNSNNLNFGRTEKSEEVCMKMNFVQQYLNILFLFVYLCMKLNTSYVYIHLPLIDTECMVICMFRN